MKILFYFIIKNPLTKKIWALLLCLLIGTGLASGCSADNGTLSSSSSGGGASTATYETSSATLVSFDSSTASAPLSITISGSSSLSNVACAFSNSTLSWAATPQVTYQSNNTTAVVSGNVLLASSNTSGQVPYSCTATINNTTTTLSLSNNSISYTVPATASSLTLGSGSATQFVAYNYNGTKTNVTTTQTITITAGSNYTFQANGNNCSGITLKYSSDVPTGFLPASITWTGTSGNSAAGYSSCTGTLTYAPSGTTGSESPSTNGSSVYASFIPMNASNAQALPSASFTFGYIVIAPTNPVFAANTSNNHAALFATNNGNASAQVTSSLTFYPNTTDKTGSWAFPSGCTPTTANASTTAVTCSAVSNSSATSFTYTSSNVTQSATYSGSTSTSGYAILTSYNDGVISASGLQVNMPYVYSVNVQSSTDSNVSFAVTTPAAYSLVYTGPADAQLTQTSTTYTVTLNGLSSVEATSTGTLTVNYGSACSVNTSGTSGCQQTIVNFTCNSLNTTMASNGTYSCAVPLTIAHTNTYTFTNNPLFPSDIKITPHTIPSQIVYASYTLIASDNTTHSGAPTCSSGTSTTYCSTTAAYAYAVTVPYSQALATGYGFTAGILNSLQSISGTPAITYGSGFYYSRLGWSGMGGVLADADIAVAKQSTTPAPIFRSAVANNNTSVLVGLAISVTPTATTAGGNTVCAVALDLSTPSNASTMVLCGGYGGNGLLGVNSTSTSTATTFSQPVQCSATSTACIKSSSGTIVLRNVVQLVAGNGTFYALTATNNNSTRQAYTWGINTASNTNSFSTPGSFNSTAVALGFSSTNPIESLSAGGYNACALMHGISVTTACSNIQSAQPSSLSAAIASANNCMVSCVGDNASLQIGQTTSMVSGLPANTPTTGGSSSSAFNTAVTVYPVDLSTLNKGMDVFGCGSQDPTDGSASYFIPRSVAVGNQSMCVVYDFYCNVNASTGFKPQWFSGLVQCQGNNTYAQLGMGGTYVTGQNQCYNGTTSNTVSYNQACSKIPSMYGYMHPVAVATVYTSLSTTGNTVAANSNLQPIGFNASGGTTSFNYVNGNVVAPSSFTVTGNLYLTGMTNVALSNSFNTTSPISPSSSTANVTGFAYSTNSGLAYEWGDNSFGQFGTGITSAFNFLQPMPGANILTNGYQFSGLAAIFSNYGSTCVVNAAGASGTSWQIPQGAISCFGTGNYGQGGVGYLQGLIMSGSVMATLTAPSSAGFMNLYSIGVGNMIQYTTNACYYNYPTACTSTTVCNSGLSCSQAANPVSNNFTTQPLFSPEVLLIAQ